MTTETTTQQTADNSSTTTTEKVAETTQQTADTTPTQQTQATQATQTTAAAAKAAEWGETWRDDYATKAATVDGKLDEKLRDKIANRLKRFSSVKDTLDWTFNADKKISEGSYKKAPDAGASAEEIAEYRKAHGIPDDPAKYLENLPAGIKIADEDKALFDNLAKHMHGLHADPKIMHGFADWYYQIQRQQDELFSENNIKAKQETEDALRADFGPDYRTNINLVNAFVGTMPKEVQETLFKSVTPDGKQIMNDPGMVKWLAQQARELQYTGTVTLPGQEASKGLDQEIADIESKMGDRRSEYWKGAMAPGTKDTVMQVRYRELIDMKNRMGSRAA